MNRRHHLLLFLIFVLAGSLRFLGPFLKQSTGDSLYYAALAMNLERGGLTHYNFYQVNLAYTSESQDKVPYLMLSSSPSGQEGDFIRQLRDQHLDYYIHPIHFIPYGYPAILMLTHRATAPSPNQAWSLVNLSIHPVDLWLKLPWEFFRAQGLLLLPSIVSSFLILALIYKAAKAGAGEEAGLWAAFLFATFPIDILTSQHLWADDILTFFCVTCFLCWQKARKNQSLVWAVLSGITLGGAILTKPSGLFFALALVVSDFLTSHLKAEQKPSLKLLTAIVFTTLVMTCHWFWLMWSQYGNPLYLPKVTDAAGQTDYWHQWLNHRPHAGILLTFGILCLSPGLFLGIRGIDRLDKTIYTAIFFTAICIICDLREYRYVLPVVPLVCIGASETMTSMGRTEKRIPILVTFALAQTIWSFWLTYRYVWQSWGEIPFPF